MAGPPVLLANDKIYSLKNFAREAELEKEILEHSQEVFGRGTIYFPIKQRVDSPTKQRVTDGLLLDLTSPESPRFWVVEAELSSHDMMSTVGPQIKNFLSALKNEETLRNVRDTLYDGIRSDASNRALVREAIGKDEDLHYFLDKLLHNERARGVLIVIDEYVDELEELVSEWFTGQRVEILIFKTYEIDSKKIYYFTPYMTIEKTKLPEKKYSEIHISWEAAYNNAPVDIRKLADELTESVAQKFSEIEHGPALTRSWYKFFVENVKVKRKALFLVFWLTRTHLHLRIGVNATNFRDPNHMAKSYKGFFWAKMPNIKEVGFNVTTPDDLENALTLVKQSFERANQ